MIYVYSSPRGSGKTTRAIELLNKNVDNVLMLQTLYQVKDVKPKIFESKTFNKKHSHLIDRKIKSFNSNLIGYRINDLIIDDPYFGFENVDVIDKIRQHNKSVLGNTIILTTFTEEESRYIQLAEKVRINASDEIGNLIPKTSNMVLNIYNKYIEVCYNELILLKMLSLDKDNIIVPPKDEYFKNVLAMINIPSDWTIKINELPC